MLVNNRIFYFSLSYNIFEKIIQVFISMIFMFYKLTLETSFLHENFPKKLYNRLTKVKIIDLKVRYSFYESSWKMFKKMFHDYNWEQQQNSQILLIFSYTNAYNFFNWDKNVRLFIQTLIIVFKNFLDVVLTK